MSAVELDVTLRTPPRPWRRVELLARTASTNTLALRADGPWEVIVTEHQVRGRGRLERVWEVPAGAALTFSATVPVPPVPGWVPLAAGLAVAEGVTGLTGVAARLKWPNDVLLPADARRKTCGILCELRTPTPAAPGLVVVGVGLNVDQTRAELPVATATSLALAGAGDVDRAALLVAVLDRLAHHHRALATGGDAAARVRAAYRAACATVGARVRLTPAVGDPFEAVAVGVDEDGALLVDAGSGVQAYAAGDVTHVRAAHPGEGLA